MDGFPGGRESQRASCVAFCRNTITRIADKGHLQRAHIETLLSERVLLLVMMLDRVSSSKYNCIVIIPGFLQPVLPPV